MNWNFIMAGSETNGLLLALAVFLAWKVAGYIGADYFLLRFVGVPGRVRKPSQKKTWRLRQAGSSK